jgi:hypothetical protein
MSLMPSALPPRLLTCLAEMPLRKKRELGMKEEIAFTI